MRALLERPELNTGLRNNAHQTAAALAANVEVRGMLSTPRLHWAAGEGLLDLAVALLERTGVNSRSADGSSALHFAARSNRIDMARELLVRRGAAIDLSTNTGCTPLIEASHYGRLEAVQLLRECSPAALPTEIPRPPL